jgi:hypothetical protein
VGSSSLIAEGSNSLPVIFTSLRDDSYGLGGTFDTGSDGLSTPAPGDYGGLFFAAGSTGSIDRAVMTYAGGTTPIEGGFDRFNPIAIQQAQVRIANSRFKDNDDGLAATGRNGLLANGPGTIFVRGAQPVIVNNIFENNQGPMLTFNANGLSALPIGAAARAFPNTLPSSATITGRWSGSTRARATG